MSARASQRKTSFRTAVFLVIVGASLIPALLSSYTLIRKISQIMLCNAQRELSLTSDRIVAELKQELLLFVERAKALGSDSDIQRGAGSVLFLSRVDFLLQRFVAQNQLVSAIFFTDSRGELTAAWPPAAWEQKIPVPRGASEVGLARGEKDFVFFVPVLDVAGQQAGMLAFKVPMGRLLSAARELVPGQSEVDFIDGTGSLLARKGGADLGPKRVSADSALVLDRFGAGRTPLFRVRVSEPYAVRQQIVSQTIRQQVVGLAGLLLILLAVIVWLSRWLIRPVHALTVQVAAYARGDYQAAPPSVPFQELDRFAATLADLGGRVSRQIEQAAERERMQGELARADSSRARRIAGADATSFYF